MALTCPVFQSGVKSRKRRQKYIGRRRGKKTREKLGPRQKKAKCDLLVTASTRGNQARKWSKERLASTKKKKPKAKKKYRSFRSEKVFRKP